MERNNRTYRLIGTVVAGVPALKIGELCLKKVENPALEGIALYAIPLLVVLLLVRLFHVEKSLRLTNRSWSGIFRYGWYLWAAGFCFLVLNGMSLPEGVAPERGRVAGFVITCVLTAIFEEIWCRGLIQNLIYHGKGAKGASPFRRIAAASLIFALLHVLNLIEQPQWRLGTLTQVCYTFSLGLLLGVIYERTQNLWVPIVLHGVFNAMGNYPSIFQTAGEAAGDISVAAMAIQLVIMLPGIYVAYRMSKALPWGKA